MLIRPNYILSFLLLLLINSDLLAKDFSVLSYNAYLLPKMENDSLPERGDKIIDVVLKTDSDFVCLQEVWTNESRQQFTAKLKQKYPNFKYIKNGRKLKRLKTLSNFHENKSSCSMSDFYEIIRCKLFTDISKCGVGKPVTECLKKYCPTYLEHRQCWNCVIGVASDNHGVPTESQIINNCVLGNQISSFEMNPAVMIFSKYPIEKTEEAAFHFPNLPMRGGISALIDLGDGLKVKTGCSHFELIEDEFGFNFNHDKISSKDLNLDSFGFLYEMTKKLSDRKLPMFLVGDFNTEIEYWLSKPKDKVFRHPANNLEVFLSKNPDFKSSPEKLDRGYGFCSFCPGEKGIFKKGPEIRFSHIDHILFSNQDSEYEVKLKNFNFATKTTDYLSDHLAVYGSYKITHKPLIDKPK